MPAGDGRGPLIGPVRGGRGRMRGGGLGGPKNCVCPKCGHRRPHVRGTPCTRTKCPKCGTLMIRGD